MKLEIAVEGAAMLTHAVQAAYAELDEEEPIVRLWTDKGDIALMFATRREASLAYAALGGNEE